MLPPLIGKVHGGDCCNPRGERTNKHPGCNSRRGSHSGDNSLALRLAHYFAARLTHTSKVAPFLSDAQRGFGSNACLPLFWACKLSDQLLRYRPMNKADLEARVAAFPYWYHRIELPHGVVTPGWSPISAKAHRVPEDLSGKRVLDVGAWDGYWTFEALRRGAREVVAIDDFSDFLGQLDHAERREWETFDLCREAIGYDEERCRRKSMSVYDVSPDALGGMFDVVFCFGTLYHLRHPLLALDKLSGVCTSELYVESAILDDYSPYRGGLGQGYPNHEMVAEFYPGAEYGSNPSNWWVPTLKCLAHMVLSANFTKLEAWKLSDTPDQLAVCRGFVKAAKST